MPKPMIVAATALGIAFALACTPPEERAENARDAVRQAVAKGDRAAALDDLRAAAPDTPEALLELAQLLVQVGSAPDAAWLLEEGVRRFPERDDLRLALARVALLLGNPSLAHEAVTPVAADSDEHSLALVVRAKAELNLGNLEGALGTLADAERLYPDRPEARLVRIATLLSEHRQDEARAAIEEALRTFVARLESAAAYLPLVNLHSAQDDAEATMRVLDEAIDRYPDEPMLWLLRTEALLAEDRSNDARADFRRFR